MLTSTNGPLLAQAQQARNLAPVPAGAAKTDATLPATAGQWALYKVDAPAANGRPRVEALRLAYLGQTGPNHSWQMEMRLSNGHHFSVQWSGAQSRPFNPSQGVGEVQRYILRPHGRPALEYRDAVTQRALLPEWGFAQQLVPRADPHAKWNKGFFDRGSYLSWPITLAESGTGGVGDLAQAAPRVLELNPDVVTGTTDALREDTLGDPLTGAGATYREMTVAELEQQLQAGRNYFFAGPTHVEPLLEQPAFFDYRKEFALAVDSLPFPEALYRSNFTGCSGYVDEPGYLFMRDNAGKLAPAEITSVAERFRAEVKAISDGRSPVPRLAKYSDWFLENQYRSHGYALGNFHFRERSIPVFEASISHVWYSMETGRPGAMYESSREFPELSSQCKELFGVEFPATTEAMMKYHAAILRGAARNFGGTWGIGIYGELPQDTHQGILKAAYDRGASRFIFYTGGNKSHVPYAVQLQGTQFLRDYSKANPRPDMKGLRSKAATCLVLPDGYHADYYLHRWKALWGQPQLFGLDMVNPQGATYRKVLGQFMQQAAQLATGPEEFDVAIDTAGFRPRGYSHLIYVRANGQVEKVKGAP